MTLRPRIVSSVVALLATLILVVPFAVAAEENPSPLRPGVRALQFSIEEDFRLGAFDGSTLAFKQHGSAGSAWRFAGSVGLAGSSSESERSFQIPDTTLLGESENRTFSIGLGVTRIWYPQPAKRVTPYWGVGPRVQYSRSNTDVRETAEPWERRQRSWSVGFGGLVGGEWFVTRAIGVHAEYSASLGYSRSSQDTVYEPSSSLRDERLESSTWSFRGNGVRFGASWYF